MYKYKNKVLTESDIDAFNSIELEWLFNEYEKIYRSAINEYGKIYRSVINE